MVEHRLTCCEHRPRTGRDCTCRGHAKRARPGVVDARPAGRYASGGLRTIIRNSRESDPYTGSDHCDHSLQHRSGTDGLPAYEKRAFDNLSCREVVETHRADQMSAHFYLRYLRKYLELFLRIGCL